MGLFSFDRDGSRCRVAYEMPGTFTRITQPAPAECPPGYLHLYEHMVIRTNLELLTRLQRSGSVHNAVTTADDVSFYLLSPTGTQGVEAEELLNRGFDPDDFALERRTVLEERRLTPEGNVDVDKLLGTASEIAAFELDVLNDVRATLQPPLEIVYGPRPAHSGRPAATLTPPANLRTRCADPDWTRLVAFFTHMVDVASPHPVDWTLAGRSPEYIRENKENLLFRYELAVTGLKRFDEEFGRYLRTVGLHIDLARTFEEVPWEDLLPAA